MKNQEKFMLKSDHGIVMMVAMIFLFVFSAIYFDFLVDIGRLTSLNQRRLTEIQSRYNQQMAMNKIESEIENYLPHCLISTRSWNEVVMYFQQNMHKTCRDRAGRHVVIELLQEAACDKSNEILNFYRISLWSTKEIWQRTLALSNHLHISCHINNELVAVLRKMDRKIPIGEHYDGKFKR